MTRELRSQVKTKINDTVAQPKSRAEIAREKSIARNQGNK